MGQVIGWEFLLYQDLHFLYRNAPYVGMLTILLNDYPTFKYIVIGLMFVTVLVSKDPSWTVLN